MKNKIPILLLLIFIIPFAAEAKFSKYIGIGLNRSSFRTEESQSLFGAAVELGLDYYPVSSFGAFIGTGINYLNRRSFLENRTWPSSFELNYSENVKIGEINVNISYLEIPLHIGYSIKMRDNLICSIFSGYSLSVPIVDHSKSKINSVRELKPDEFGRFDYDYDYVLVDEPSMGLSNNYIIGFRTTCNHYSLILCYLKALSITKSISGKSLKDKIDTFKISVAYQF